MWADLNNQRTHVYGSIVRDMGAHSKPNTNWSIIFGCIPVKNHLPVHSLVVAKFSLVRKIWKSTNERTRGEYSLVSSLAIRRFLFVFSPIENDHFNVNSVNEALPIVPIERNINTCIHRINRTTVALVDVIKPIHTHHVSEFKENVSDRTDECMSFFPSFSSSKAYENARISRSRFIVDHGDQFIVGFGQWFIDETFESPSSWIGIRKITVTVVPYASSFTTTSPFIPRQYQRASSATSPSTNCSTTATATTRTIPPSSSTTTTTSNQSFIDEHDEHDR